MALALFYQTGANPMQQGFSEKIKTWFAGEKEKLRNKTPRQKADYILRYYWLWILVIIVVIYFGTFTIYRMNFAPKNNWLYGIFANTMGSGGNHSQLWYDFEDYAGYDLKEKNLEFVDSSWFDPSKTGGTFNSYYQSFVALAEAGTLDFVTMGEEGLTELGRSGRLLDLNMDKCNSIREKYGDRFVTCLPLDEEYSKEEVPVGIDLSDSLLVTKYHLYDDSCVIGIGANSKNLEQVERFLDFVLGSGQEVGAAGTA